MTEENAREEMSPSCRINGYNKEIDINIKTLWVSPTVLLRTEVFFLVDM